MTYFIIAILAILAICLIAVYFTSSTDVEQELNDIIIEVLAPDTFSKSLHKLEESATIMMATKI